jgi:hypothetical protein
MGDDPRLPKASDFPPGTTFVIREFDVPLAWVPHQGWFNWYGGVPCRYDRVPGYGLTEWPAESFEEWVGIIEASLKKRG